MISWACLIIPPSLFLCDEKVFPSLGILKVAAVLEQAGHKCSVIDLNGVSNYLECLEQALKGLHPDFFGITCTSPQMPAVRLIIERLREIAPGCRICLGGPHITGTFASAKLDRAGKAAGRGIRHLAELHALADILLSGDGEVAIFKVLEAVEQGANFPILIDADQVDSEMFLSEEALSAMPFPARHLISLDSYHYKIEGRAASNVIGELGCPYSCLFCGNRNSPSFRRVRARTPASICAELVHLYRQYNLRATMFADDELNIPSNFSLLMTEIIRMQETLGVDWRFRCFLKSNLLTESQASLLYQAGARNVLVGFESGSDRILTNIQKKASRDQNVRCMEICSKYGLKVKALISLGHAGETEETIQATEDFLLETQPSEFDATLLAIYPATGYSDFSQPHASIPGAWTYTAKNGDRLHFYDIDFTKDTSYYKGVPGDYASHIFTDALSCEQLVQMRDSLEENVRRKLNIPFYPVNAARFESSMGLTPAHVLRHSNVP